MEEVIETVRSTGCDMMAITEAWQIVPEMCNIENFVLFHHLRVNRGGGGVALFCRADLNPSHLRVDIPEGVEALWVRLNPRLHPRHTASIIMCVVYHPPRAHTAALLTDHIIETADSLRLKYPAAKLVICGDFNRLDTNAPWMTPRIKRLIKQRNRAYYTDRPLFRSLRNKVIKEISIAKSSYYPNKVEHLKQQNNSQWFTTWYNSDNAISKKTKCEKDRGNCALLAGIGLTWY
ncbi:uncharacterized protein LOC143040545 [Oratosquilla oratoria]|uniref:uncharacterized protein LOC143040545 n=1 Tax=Oratosquilla oratoria TaxID=337810 RepID=UPI003F75B280